MSEFNIEVQGGSSVRLPTAGKYCDRDIIVTASGGGGTEEIENIIDQSGVLETTDGTVTEKVGMLTHYVDVFKKVYRLSYYGIKTLEHIDFYIDFVGYELDFQYSSVKTMVGVDVSKLYTCRNMLGYCRELVSIQIPFDMSSKSAYHMSGMFWECYKLVDVRFVEGTIKESITIPSPVLSDESKDSIINGLAYVTTAQTLTVSKNAGFTAEHKATAQSKGWTVVEQ